MSKRLQYFMASSMALGFLTKYLSTLFRDYLSDFAYGFCEGVYLALICTGLIYIFWCLIKGKKPFIIERNNTK